MTRTEPTLESASTIQNTPAGNIAATNVQDAINELDTEKVDLSGDSMTGALSVTSSDAANATALTVTQEDTGTAIAATIVNGSTGDGLFIDQNGNGRALSIDSESTTANGVNIAVDTLTSGIGLNVTSDSADTSARNVVKIINDNTLAIGAVGLTIKQDSSAYGVIIDQNGNGRALSIDSEATSQNGMQIDVDVLTTGNGLHVTSDSASTSARNIVKIVNDNVLATGAVGLTVQQDSSAAGVFIDENGDGVALHIDNDGTANSITVEGTTATDFTVSKAGDVYIAGDCSALTFTDRTPFYDGDALSELKLVKGKNGEIDHSTLPAFAKISKIKDVFEKQIITENVLDESGNIITEQKTVFLKIGEEIENGRDIGAMISILTKAIQQLTKRIEKLET